MSVPEYPKIDTLFERDPGIFKVDVTRIRRPEFEIPQLWLVTEKVDGTNVRVSLEQEPHDHGNATGSACIVGENACDYYRDKEWRVVFYGRTAAAQMPTFLLDHLQRTFTLERMRALWRCKPNCALCFGNGKLPILSIKDSVEITGEAICPNLESYPIVLYGEGYGARIQKGGGNYRRDGDVSFRLFDVLIGSTWLRRADVEDVARQLDIKPVPRVDADGIHPLWTIDECVALVTSFGGLRSTVAREEGTPSFAEGIVAFTDPPLFNGRGQRLIWKLKTKDF